MELLSAYPLLFSGRATPLAEAATSLHQIRVTGSQGWFEALPQNQREKVWNYLKRRPDESSEIAWELIRLAWSSVAALVMAPLQDVLNLGREARMNLPGRVEGNWRWRCPEDMLSEAVLQRLHELTAASNRVRQFGQTV
jgi:4-alpha-glucanotransferase